MTSTVKSLAVTGVMLILMSGLFASHARAQVWGRTAGLGQQVARSMSSGGMPGRSPTGGSGGGQKGQQSGGESAVSVAVGPGGVGVAVATDNSAVAIAVGGGGVGVGVAKANGKAVSVGVGGDGVAVGADRGNSAVQPLTKSPAAISPSLRSSGASGGNQRHAALGRAPLARTGGYWDFGRD